MTAALAFAFVLASASTTPCPSGDVPQGAPGAWTRVQARLTLRIDDDDVGHLRVRLRWRNETEGAASGAATIASGDSVLVVTGARVRHGDVTATSTLVEAQDADVAFSMFVDALSAGVPDDEVQRGRARVAAVVQAAGDDGDDDQGTVVRAAGACSARVVDVELDALLTSVPHDGGLRFFVPRVFADSVVDVDGDGAVWIDGRATRRARMQADSSAANDEDVAATGTFVVDVFRAGRAGEGPRVHGGLVALRPLPAPASSTNTPATASAREEPTPASFSLVHAAVDLPRPLLEAPDELRVVFVVDASVSAGDVGVARALQLVDAVLDELPPDAAWALVTAARRPTLVVPPWRDRRERHRPTIAVQNGSNVADAVALARRIAADALPGRGRVIVLSDLQQRQGDRRLATSIHPSSSSSPGELPLVHVVALPADMDAGRGLDFARATSGGDDVSGVRVDAAAAEATGGVFVDVDTSGGGDARELARYLVRPTRLDEPELVVDGVVVGPTNGVASAWRAFAPGGDEDDVHALPTSEALPDFVLEGGGLRASWRLPDAARRATLRGRLWGTTVELPLSHAGAWPTASTGAAVAALHDVLGDDDIRAAARRRGFVSRVTSLLSLPAWRPGRPEGFGFARGCSCGCCGHVCGGYGTAGRGIGHAGPPPVLVEQGVLDRLAAEAAERCDSAVDVDIEAGDLEILEVVARKGGACVREFFWAQRLDRIATGDASFEQHGVRSTRAPRPTKTPPPTSTEP